MSFSRRNSRDIMQVTERLFHSRRRKRDRECGRVLPYCIEMLIVSFLTGKDPICTREQLNHLRVLLSCCRDSFFLIHDTVEATELALNGLPFVPRYGLWMDDDLIETQSGCETMHRFANELFALFASLQIAKDPTCHKISHHPFERQGHRPFFRRRTTCHPADPETRLLSAEDVFSFIQHVLFPDSYAFPENIKASAPFSHVMRFHANRRGILIPVLRATLALAMRLVLWCRRSGSGGVSAYFNIADAISQEASMCIDSWFPLKFSSSSDH